MATTERYEEFRRDYDSYPKGPGTLAYHALGLTGEAGEVADKIKKAYRDNGGAVTGDGRIALAFELGDALWYLTALADDLGFTLSEIMDLNIAKLTDRRARGAQRGSGDNR